MIYNDIKKYLFQTILYKFKCWHYMTIRLSGGGKYPMWTLSFCGDSMGKKEPKTQNIHEKPNSGTKEPILKTKTVLKSLF